MTVIVISLCMCISNHEKNKIKLGNFLVFLPRSLMSSASESLNTLHHYLIITFGNTNIHINGLSNTLDSQFLTCLASTIFYFPHLSHLLIWSYLRLCLYKWLHHWWNLNFKLFTSYQLLILSPLRSIIPWNHFSLPIA